MANAGYCCSIPTQAKAENTKSTIEILVFFTTATAIEMHYNDHRIPDDYFKQQLQVRRASFNELLNMVNPHVARQDTSMRWRLVYTDEYMEIRMCPLLSFLTSGSQPSPKLYKMPWTFYMISEINASIPTTIAEMTECIETFQGTRSDLPNVVGAIDGTITPIIAPRVDAVDYFSRYQQHDMIV